jgi:hypothetical protein
MLVVFCQLPFFALSELAFRFPVFAFRNAAAALADADLNEWTGFLGGLGFFYSCFSSFYELCLSLFVRLSSFLYFVLSTDLAQQCCLLWVP